MAITFGFLNKLERKIEHTGGVILEKASKAWSWCTGKDKCDQAKNLYENICKDFESARHHYEAHVKKREHEINSNLTVINAIKKEIIHTLFPRFAGAANRFATWEVIINKLLDRFHYKLQGSDKIAPRAELFIIDFDKYPWKSYAKAWFTYGFWSRKEAKETLEKVLEQKMVVENEIAKMNADEVRLDQIHSAIQQVKDYFESLSRSYRLLLDELEYSVNMLSSICHMINPSFQGKTLDCYFLPDRHLQCLMAAEKMTRILHEIAERHYIDQDCNLIHDDWENIRVSVSETKNITRQWAA
jgi:hypothetical protein